LATVATAAVSGEYTYHNNPYGDYVAELVDPTAAVAAAAEAAAEAAEAAAAAAEAAAEGAAAMEGQAGPGADMGELRAMTAVA
jgi:hypothetical protein